MSPLLEWTLVGWSLLAVCWWAIAIGLVSCERYRSRRPRAGAAAATPQTKPPVSIFKPMAALREAAPPPSLVSAMESFVRESDDHAEILLGIEDKDAPKWQPVIERWQQNFP
ncbi:MAG: hypothetical protein ACLQDC_18335, partial [Verrucomicrobiia bacterium]